MWCESKCVGCGSCARYCPVKVSDTFNMDLSETKCIHLHFAQTVPLVSVIDPEHCLFLTNRECKICFPVCKNRAIDLYQTEQEIEIRVGAIILSTGYRPYNPTPKLEYGYGRMANVITSLEFERISCASGPYKGIVARPSDKRPPRRIAWIQCVGSRDIVSGNAYCSAVCCMYAIKQVIMSKDGPPRGEIIPVYLSSTGVPSPVTGSAAGAILDRLTGLSASLGLTISKWDDQAFFGYP